MHPQRLRLMGHLLCAGHWQSLAQHLCPSHLGSQTETVGISPFDRQGARDSEGQRAVPEDGQEVPTGPPRPKE